MKKIAVVLATLVVLGLIGLAVITINGTEATVKATPTTPIPISPADPDTQAASSSNQENTSFENASAPEPVTQTSAASVQAITPAESIGQLAMDKAAKENKYVFLFFSENDSPETAMAKTTFESAAKTMEDTIQLAYVDKNQPAEKAVVEQLGLDGAPMPLVLAVAPNGAVTGAYFGDKLKEPKLEESIAGAGEQQCMKALQNGKLVFFCMQNATTKSNDLAMQGVKDFKDDPRFTEVTEVVTVDPTDKSEQRFLAKLKIDPNMDEATAAFLAPPGSLIKTIKGATTKDALLTVLTAATSGGCGGGKCSPGACGPKR